MKVLIVEDEQLAVEKLVQTLKNVAPEAEVIGSTDSVRSSIQWLRSNPGLANLILMDIELADGQSFAIFDEVQVDCPVIFTTSYDEYALKAFKVNSIDYLLKPILQGELKNALNKLRFFKGADHPVNDQAFKIENLVRELQKNAGLAEYRKRFLVKYMQKMVPVGVDTIAYFYSDEKVSFFKCADSRTYIVDYTMDDIEKEVDPRFFFRVNRAMIVGISSIDQIDPYFGNRLALRLKPDYEKAAVVSREKVNDFKIWMGK